QEGDYAGAGPRAPPSTCHGSDGDGGACQLTPPHDLIAAFARRWLREQVLTAKDWEQSPRTRRREGCKGQQQSRLHGAETQDIPREATWTVQRPKLSQTSWRGGPGSSPHHISMSFLSGSKWAGQMKDLSFFSWSTPPGSGKPFPDNPTQLLPQPIPSSLVT
ncbi:hypothetical protein E2I00_016379, partial [Balaenoptera physalus]